VLGQRLDQGGLVGEVAVQHRLGHAGLGGHGVHQQVRTVGAEHPEAGRDELGAAPFPVRVPPVLPAVAHLTFKLDTSGHKPACYQK